MTGRVNTMQVKYLGIVLEADDDGEGELPLVAWPVHSSLDSSQSDRGLPELCRCPLQEAPLLFTVCSAATLALRLPTLERLMQQT